MNTPTNTTVAVLTGDLIRSSRSSAAALEAVRSHLAGAVSDIARWHTSLVPLPADFLREDSWQFLLHRPELALRAAVFIRARLISEGSDTKVVIGVGDLATLSDERASFSSGSAFVRSAHAIERLGSGRRMQIADSDRRQPPEPDWPNVSLELVEALLERLTARQAQLLALALHPQRRTHETIARMLEPAVERQVVSKTLSRAGYGAIEAAILAFEQTYG